MIPSGEVPANIEAQGWAKVVYGDDSALQVVFSKRKIRVPELKDEHGAVTREESFVDKDWIEITLPKHSKVLQSGDVISREVRHTDKVRFPVLWERYEKGLSGDYGNPLSLLAHPDMDPAMIAEYAKQQITTIERLAAMPDSSLPYLPGPAISFRKAAQKWIAEKSTVQLMQQAGVDVGALMARLAELEAKVGDGEKPEVEAVVEKPKAKGK